MESQENLDATLHKSQSSVLWPGHDQGSYLHMNMMVVDVLTEDDTFIAYTNQNNKPRLINFKLHEASHFEVPIHIGQFVTYCVDRDDEYEFALILP